METHLKSQEIYENALFIPKNCLSPKGWDFQQIGEISQTGYILQLDFFPVIL